MHVSRTIKKNVGVMNIRSFYYFLTDMEMIPLWRDYRVCL